MEYYTSNEAQAVAQISRRIADTRGREFEDWSPEEIIQPKLKRYSYNPSSRVSSILLVSSRRMRKTGRSRTVDRFSGKFYRPTPSSSRLTATTAASLRATEDGWVKMVESAASGDGMGCVRGRGCQNEYNQAERVLKPLALLKLKGQNSGLSAEIIDSNQIHGQTEHKVIKILFIMNSGRVAPYKTKAFVAALCVKF